MSGYSVLREDMEYEEASQLNYGEGVMCRNENTLLRELINNNKDSCVTS